MKLRRFMQLALVGGVGMTLVGDEKRGETIEPRRYAPFLVNPRGFLIVKHDALNNSFLCLEAVVEECLYLGDHTNGRIVVPACEGDLFMLPESGDLIFTHQNFGKVTKEDFEAKRGAGKAAYFNDVLEKYLSFPIGGMPAPVLCIELKSSTSVEAVIKVHTELSKAGMGAEQVYFDSFFSNKLDLVAGNYAKSRHLMARFGSIAIAVDRFPQNGYDLVTVPRMMAFGLSREQTIYGAVGSFDQLKKAAEDDWVLGAGSVNK